MIDSEQLGEHVVQTERQKVYVADWNLCWRSSCNLRGSYQQSSGLFFPQEVSRVSESYMFYESIVDLSGCWRQQLRPPLHVWLCRLLQLIPMLIWFKCYNRLWEITQEGALASHGGNTVCRLTGKTRCSPGQKQEIPVSRFSSLGSSVKTWMKAEISQPAVTPSFPPPTFNFTGLVFVCFLLEYTECGRVPVCFM